MTAMDPLHALAGAGETFATLLAPLTPERQSATTPCGAWSVRELANHVVGGNLILAAVLRDDAPPDRAADHLGDDWAAAQRAAVTGLVAELERPGMLTRLHRTPLGEAPGSVLVVLRTVEHAVHGWDLAVSTGQSPQLLDPLAEAVYQPSVAMLGRLPDGARRPFAESVPVAADRAPIDRLVGLLGRDPDWQPVVG
jgi:uncharacterized protein (TIGR03086 family)